MSYLLYHLSGEPQRFNGTGFIRPLYFTLLISHIILAVIVVPLVLMTVRYGLKDLRQKHRRLAPWTFWMWPGCVCKNSSFSVRMSRAGQRSR